MMEERKEGMKTSLFSNSFQKCGKLEKVSVSTNDYTKTNYNKKCFEKDPFP